MPNPCRLIAFTPFPTGSFPYKEVHDGKIYEFPDVGLDIHEQSRAIAKFRRVNNFPRASYTEALDDLNIYTCQRLGCDPRFCSDGTASQAQPQQVQTGGCRSCGAKV